MSKTSEFPIPIHVLEIQFHFGKPKLLVHRVKFDFKCQVFPSHQDRKTNSSVCFLGEVMAQQFCFEIY